MAEKKYLEIEADYNDGDYTTQRSLITEKALDELKPILKIVKREKGNVEKFNNFLDENQEDLLAQYLPSAPEGSDIHTIESIKVLVVSEEVTLL